MSWSSTDPFPHYIHRHFSSTVCFIDRKYRGEEHTHTHTPSTLLSLYTYILTDDSIGKTKKNRFFFFRLICF